MNILLEFSNLILSPDDYPILSHQPISSKPSSYPNYCTS